MTGAKGNYGGKRDGAGRKASPDKKVPAGVTVHPAAKAKLVELAKQTGLSQSDVFERLVKSAKSDKVLRLSKF